MICCSLSLQPAVGLLWGEERKKGPQVKICLLRFCEDLFVCLFSFVGTDEFTSFQYAESEKEKKVPFDLIVYCVVQKCQKTVPLLFIYYSFMK